MRVPLSPHGVRELLIFGGGSAAAGVVAFHLAPWASPPLFLLAAFTLSFFRDPERAPEGGAEAAVAPADGAVTDVGIVEEPQFLRGRALRVGIFLSVLDVHVNRVPLDGKAVFFRYSPGAFVDARDAEAIERNEANLVGFHGPRGPFAVRQVAGLIARRIVCPLREGDTVARGQRMGMIKFGSRTELLVPADAPVTVEVEVGRKVKGGRTVVLRYER
ncbi:MAG: phosphatidylserine decarboxylase [Planctomycetota bacterium]